MSKILPPYFSPLLGIAITEPGTYITRCGELVTVEAEGKRQHFHGRYSCNTAERWHRSGRIFPGRETRNDIVRAAP